MLATLNSFGENSGLFLNAQKSKVSFPRNLSPYFRNLISKETNIGGSTDFRKYLGIKISPNKLKKGDYALMLDKTKDK